MSKDRCYRPREWVTVQLPPEAAAGLEVARSRTRSLVHDLAGEPIEDMLVAAYLQGVMDGSQAAARPAPAPAEGEKPLWHDLCAHGEGKHYDDTDGRGCWAPGCPCPGWEKA